jgi:cystathionine beta-lyase
LNSKDECQNAAESFDFDRIVERRGTDSMKWGRYGDDVLPLWVADMDFQSPKAVIDALRQRVEHGVYGYGIEPPELRPVIQERLQRLYGWQVNPDDMLFLPGVFVGFNLVPSAFSEAGDGLLIQTPVYPPFHAIANNIGRTLQTAPLAHTDKGFEIDYDLFERSITPSTRVFLLCNPHNPVGRVFTRAELERLAEICLRHDLIICSDEIHQDFIYEGHSHIPIATLGPEVAARTITLLSPSKSFNIAGFHFSIAIAGNPENRDRLKAAAAGRVPNRPGIFDFVAGLAAYRYGGEWFANLIEYLRGNRDFLLRYLKEEIPQIRMHEPEGTYLGWLDCRGAGIDGSPAEFFVKEAKVALQDGALFGVEGQGFVRLNFGCPRSVLAEALARMKASLYR